MGAEASKGESDEDRPLSFRVNARKIHAKDTSEIDERYIKLKFKS